MSDSLLPEIEIVKDFAKVCPYRIDPASVEKRKPPEPDTRCKTADGFLLAIEVVQVVDSVLAKGMSDSLWFRNSLEKGITLAPLGLQKTLLRKFGNAMLSIWRKPGTTQRQIESAIPQLLAFLTQQADNVEGELSLTKNSVLHELFSRVIVFRGGFAGPRFSAPGGSSFSEPLLESLQRKFAKVYSTDLPIDLLAVYYRQPEPLPGDLQDGLEFVRLALPFSPFWRIWVYSYVLHRVLAVHPQPENI